MGEWHQDRGYWSAPYGGVISTAGAGFADSFSPANALYDHGTAFGHGVSLLAIKPWELDAGEIKHALEITIDRGLCDGKYLPPGVITATGGRLYFAMM